MIYIYILYNIKLNLFGKHGDESVESQHRNDKNVVFLLTLLLNLDSLIPPLSSIPLFVKPSDKVRSRHFGPMIFKDSKLSKRDGDLLDRQRKVR